MKTLISGSLSKITLVFLLCISFAQWSCVEDVAPTETDPKITVPLPGDMVVALTASECTWLGGTVIFWGNCEGTNQKCVGANGRERCITTAAE